MNSGPRCTVALTVLLLIRSALGQTAHAPSFDDLRERARDLASKAYAAVAEPKLPDALASLDYDQYQQVQFRPEAGPWHDQKLRFDLRLICRGYIYREPVKLHLLEGGQEQQVRFTISMFNPGRVQFKGPVPEGLDFAGFKVVYRESDPRQPWSEVASFVGASYFRLVGKGLRYGASARALALDTGEAAGEEFPRFTEFWIQKPEPLAAQLHVMALLDSPSVAGACRFLLNVADQTSADIEVSLFPRSRSKKYGIAPLTSMFLMGKNRTRYVPDFRPEVHDSDGLLVAVSDSERLWRPLENPEKRHRITRIPLHSFVGFGLMQRDRSFPSYEDLAARYDLRPSLWVEPLTPWLDGELQLVEIPSPAEYNDNIVAYWVPAQKPEPGNEMRFRYRLTALGQQPKDSLLRVTATRITPAGDKRAERFVVDFEGANLDALDAPAPRAHCTARGCYVKNLQAIPNDVTGGWRVVFDVEPREGEARQIRLFLESSGKPVSEVWVQDLPTS